MIKVNVLVRAEQRWGAMWEQKTWSIGRYQVWSSLRFLGFDPSRVTPKDELVSSVQSVSDRLTNLAKRFDSSSGGVSQIVGRLNALEAMLAKKPKKKRATA
jgi:hypothetical protein